MTQTYKKQKLELLISDQKFKQRLLNLREKWGIPTDGFSSIENRNKWEHSLVNLTQSNKFNQEFENLLSNFPRHYANEIYEYLLSDTLDHIPSVGQEKVRFFWEADNKNQGKERLFIEIFSDTTIKDIQSIWRFVNKVQKSAVGYSEGRQKPKEMFERNLMIYKLSLQGKSNGEIYEIIKDQPACSRIDVADISKIIAKIRKEMRAR